MFSRIPNKGVFFIAVSQFGMAFSFGYITTFMPFYIIQISPYGLKETMIWIGLIMGASNIINALAAPFWGGLTSRFSPKLLFERGMLCNGILFLVTGFIDNLQLLLLIRIIQGALGGVSTIGYILLSAISSEKSIHKDLSLFQNSLTAGQLIGPPIGAYAASLLGYRPAFIFAFIVVTIFLIFCHFNVDDIPRQKKASYSDAPINKSLFWSWNLILIATLHLTFMPSILPEILKAFQLTENIALKYAGFIIMSYTATAILGNYFLSRLSSRIGLKKVITIACILAGVSQLLLIFSKGIFSFILIRMIQTGFIAAVIPLIFSIFARDVSGKMIGFLNSARFVGAAVGPFMATSVLAYANVFILYLFITGLTFGSLWTFMVSIKSNKSKKT